MAPGRRSTRALANLRDLLAYAATKPAHDRADRAAASALEVAPDVLGLPPGVEVRWLGVAGFALTCEGTTLVIDPYVTRRPVGDLVRRRVWSSDPVLVDRHVPRADAVLLGHTHFDHALDAPAVARRDRAPVYGGASAVRLLAMHGLGELAVEVEAHRRYEIGPFTVQFVPSVHSKLLLGLSVPNGGEITCEHVESMTPQAYCCGQVWGIRIEVGGATMYHQGSADLLDDEVPAGGVDVFLCGIAGRQVTPDYLPRIVRALDPATVVACHHDDFFRPLDGADPGFAFGVDVARFPEEVAAASRSPRVVTLGRSGAGTPGTFSA
jgi:L-ascorbate metabolism protein UlaG (beta-lactamase superfamily)